MSQRSDGHGFPRRRLARRAFLVRSGRAAVAATGVVTLAACSPASAPPTVASAAPTTAPAPPTVAATAARPATTPTAPAAKRGGTHRMTIGQADTPHLDIHLSNSSTLAGHGQGMAWSQLLWFKNGPTVKMPTFEMEGDLAASWDQPDDLTYVFKLRPGVKCQNIAPVNGREVVADDILWSFRRQIDAKVNATYLANVAKMEAPDKATFKVTVGQPDADFLVNLASIFCKVVPHEVVDQKGDMKEGPVIGSGPWIVNQWNPGQLTRLVRNPDHYIKERPYLDTFEWYRIGDPATVLSGFRSKNLDIAQTGVTKKDADAITAQDPSVQVDISTSGTRFEIALKSNKPPFDNPKVRQALFKAIDRDEIIKTVFDGLGGKGTGFLPTGPNQELPEAELAQLYKPDPDGAKRLLAEAGVSNLEVDFVVADFLAGLVVQTGELVQAQLKRVGITTRIRVMDGATFIAQVRTPPGDYTMYLGLQGSNQSFNAEVRSRIHSKGALFTTGLVDPELDAMIDRQATMVKDPQGRGRIIQDINRRIIQDAALVQLVQGGGVTLRHKYVQNYNTNGGINNSQADYAWIWHDK
jgi:ABC-type transport system substrate-binding protein